MQLDKGYIFRLTVVEKLLTLLVGSISLAEKF